MKLALVLIVLMTVVVACNNNPQKVTTVNSPESRPAFNCNAIKDNAVLYTIADSIIHNYNGKEYFELLSIDTFDVYTTEDYFTNSNTKTKLVLMSGESLPSNGTENNLLMLLSCNNTNYKVIYAGQSGTFEPSDIRDLDGDGVMEIIIQSSVTRQGTCSDHFQIINFKKEKKRTLYSKRSESQIDCGVDMNDRYVAGDTLEHKYDCSFILNHQGSYDIRQIETLKIHNGGVADSEIVNQMIVIADTTRFPVK